jgi:hypothetical protein
MIDGVRQKQPCAAPHFSVATLSQVEFQSEAQHEVWSHCPASLPQTQSRTPG